MRLKGSCKANRQFVCRLDVNPTDSSSDAMKDSFYQKLRNFLRTVRQGDIVILTGDINAKVGKLCPSKARLGSPFDFHSCRSEDRGRLLGLCSDHQLFLPSTHFRQSNHREATRHPPSWSKR